MKERLTPPPREVSDFMFEQRLFDFANKNLSAFTYRDMKNHMDSHMEAREKVGAILLAFEYFNAISEIQIEYDGSGFASKKRGLWSRIKPRLKHLAVLVFFLVLFVIVYLCLEDLIQYFQPRIQEMMVFIKQYL